MFNTSPQGPFPTLVLHINPSFAPLRDFVRVIRDPRDASRDMKMLRTRAEEAFRVGRLDFDLADGTYWEPRS